MVFRGLDSSIKRREIRPLEGGHILVHDIEVGVFRNVLRNKPHDLPRAGEPARQYQVANQQAPLRHPFIRGGQIPYLPVHLAHRGPVHSRIVTHPKQPPRRGFVRAFHIRHVVVRFIVKGIYRLSYVFSI